MFISPFHGCYLFGTALKFFALKFTASRIILHAPLKVPLLHLYFRFSLSFSEVFGNDQIVHICAHSCDGVLSCLCTFAFLVDDNNSNKMHVNLPFWNVRALFFTFVPSDMFPYFYKNFRKEGWHISDENNRG